MAAYAQRWTEIALSTDPADRPRAETAVRDIYRHGGLEPPATIVWCGSPLSMMLAQAVVTARLTAGNVAASVDSARGTVWESVWESILKSVRDSDGEGAGDNVRFSISWSIVNSVHMSIQHTGRSNAPWFRIWGTVGDRVSLRVGASVQHRIRAALRDGVRATVRVRDSIVSGISDSVIDSFQDAPWLAYTRYCHDVLGLAAQTAPVSGRWELAQSAGWALPHENICFVSERPGVLNRDDRGRLHSLTGPACVYPDGWAIHAVHGVCVQRHVIEDPARITVERIDGLRNAEIRRVMIERYRHGEAVSGAKAYLRDAGAERLDHDENYGTLWRRNVRGDEPIVMVEVVNSTPEPDGSRKRYWLRVPPDMTTAREAVAWTFGMPAQEYAPDKET